jgi:site-specific recombinase XerD
MLIHNNYQMNESGEELIQFRKILEEQHVRLGQLDIPFSRRSRTAVTYAIHIKAFFNFMNWKGYVIPTANRLEEWRDGLAAGTIPRCYKQSDNGDIIDVEDFRPYSPKGINARLSAVRKLLRSAARELYDPVMKINLKEWASIKQLSLHVKQDALEQDYGIRLSLEELATFFNSISKEDILCLRDRALIALMAGSGLRVNEATHLTLRDVFSYTTENGIPAIHVRKGKGDRSRLVALSPNSWVLRAVRDFTDAREIDEFNHPDATVIVGFKVKHLERNRSLKDVTVIDNPISNVKAWAIVISYPATHNNKVVRLRPHDLRRTYALLCNQSGMDWDALRANLGHKDLATTQLYVGRATSLAKRVPDWSI